VPLFQAAQAAASKCQAGTVSNSFAGCCTNSRFTAPRLWVAIDGNKMAPFYGSQRRAALPWTGDRSSPPPASDLSSSIRYLIRIQTHQRSHVAAPSLGAAARHQFTTPACHPKTPADSATDQTRTRSHSASTRPWPSGQLIAPQREPSSLKLKARVHHRQRIGRQHEEQVGPPVIRVVHARHARHAHQPVARRVRGSRWCGGGWVGGRTGRPCTASQADNPSSLLYQTPTHPPITHPSTRTHLAVPSVVSRVPSALRISPSECSVVKVVSTIRGGAL